MICYCVYSDADLPVVSSKDTQTENSGDSGAIEGAEKTDQDKADKKENVKQWSIDRIKKEYRRFNIDLAPKVRESLLHLRIQIRKKIQFV